MRGERRVLAVVESHDALEQILLDLPIMQQRVHVGVTALRRYEDFAADVKDRK